MQTTNQEKLLDAMMLLEVADNMYPSVEHLFAKYTTSNFISSAHDLIQYVYSSGESGVDNDTKEMLATLEAARSYIDNGGHLYNPSVDAKEVVQRSNLFQRILARFKR